MFGGVDREDPSNCFATCIRNPKVNTLIPIIQKCILPGTTIVSSEREKYDFVLKLPESYALIVDSTNHIKGFWEVFRNSLGISRGKHREQLEPFLFEVTFRQMYPKDSLFYVLLAHIVALFPLE